MNTHLAFQHHKWPSGGGGPTVPTFTGASGALFSPDPAANPLVLSHTMADAANVLIAMVVIESGGTTFDASIDTGGAKIPTFGGTTMTVGKVANSSRRHVGIYAIHPNATGAFNFSIAPTNGMRGASVRLEEWGGVNTTTIISAANSQFSNTDSNAVTLTTTHADAVIVGAAGYPDIATALTCSVGTLIEEGQTGSGATKNIRAGWARQPVTASGATEGITFVQAGNVSAMAVIAELNPA